MSLDQFTRGEVITLAAGTARVSGTAYLAGSMLVVAANTVDTTAPVSAYRQGAFTLPKASGAWTQGAILYWDDTAKNVTTTSNTGANKAIGWAYQAQASGDTTGIVILSGGVLV